MGVERDHKIVVSIIASNKFINLLLWQQKLVQKYSSKCDHERVQSLTGFTLSVKFLSVMSHLRKFYVSRHNHGY